MSLMSRSQLATASLLLMATACVFEKDGPSDANLPARPMNDEPIAAQKSSAGILEVNPVVRDDGLLLNIGAVPPEATLECDLDEKPLTPCHDGALFARPDVGDHKVTVLAMISGSIVAVGESSTFTVLPAGNGAITPEDNTDHPLSLIVDDTDFTNDMALPYNKDFTAKFRFLRTPSCEQPELRCKYDSRTSAFWTDCDAGSLSYTVSKELMAAGLQYLSAQASCGDEFGPILTLFWHGVPDAYQPLMIRAISDNSGHFIVNLVRSSDCPESQQTYECADRADGDFTLCQESNVIVNPTPGLHVRAACGEQKGPALKIGQ